ncbi:hypothetical protein [Parasitella parasitica]|uniref:Reverse transcriptase domain-containing protein n=1 Tax=Parasitella parasitica TaxID=35722 RepID=A0A0B7NTC0_9FUNG|nr:hypothetical protein [Parasitella parasitica]
MIQLTEILYGDNYSRLSLMLAILRNLFDEVHIEVILNNSSSPKFQPITGVLQGSILSPFLYSIYINGLPYLLRPHLRDVNEITNAIELAPSITSLLYADDVVLIAKPEKMPQLLQTCEDHSHSLGYRWNPTKCVIVAPPRDTQEYRLYDINIPKEASFSYLGIAIKPGGNINTAALIQQNVNKAKYLLSGPIRKGFPHYCRCASMSK